MDHLWQQKIHQKSIFLMYFEPNELNKTKSFTKINEMMLKLTFFFHFPLISPYYKPFSIYLM
jgi:hypothetical protein